MDVIILAGGKGKRLGVLTSQKQKAALPFKGVSLLEHVIDSFLFEGMIGRIYVLTGYFCNDIHDILSTIYSKEIILGKINVVDLPNVVGTLSRLSGAISQIGPQKGCLVCGIDSLVPMSVLQGFYETINCHKDELTLSFSPHLQIAPTHKVGRVEREKLVCYGCLEEIANIGSGEWYTDVGIRFFPARILEELAFRPFENNLYIPSLVAQLLQREEFVRGFVFLEDWKHFAFAEDFIPSAAS